MDVENTTFWTSHQKSLISCISFIRRSHQQIATFRDPTISIKLNIADQSFSFEERLGNTKLIYLKFHFNDCAKFVKAMNILLAKPNYGIVFLISDLNLVTTSDSPIFDFPLNATPNPCITEEGRINNYEIVDPDSLDEESEELVIKFNTLQMKTMLSLNLMKNDAKRLVEIIAEQYNLLSVEWIHTI